MHAASDFVHQAQEKAAKQAASLSSSANSMYKQAVEGAHKAQEAGYATAHKAQEAANTAAHRA